MAAAALTTEPDPPGERDVPAALVPLFAAISELDVRALSLDDDTLAAVLLGLGRASARLDAVSVPVASAWDTRGAWAQDGSKSARARLARESWRDPRQCGIALRRARKLRWMPLVSEAFSAGRIGTDRVDVLVRANASHRAAEFTEGEAHLVSVAESVADFDDFVRAVRYWTDAADGVSTRGNPEDRAKRQQESRGFDSASGLDGVRFLNGRLEAVGSEIFDGELRRLEQDLFEADWAEAREQHGKGALPEHLKRTARQRRADALVEMATRSRSLPDGAARARPLLSVLVDYPTLHGSVRELFNGTVLSAGQVASLLSEADIERVVFAGASRVIDVGARTRIFTGATRRAVEVRDRRCSFPGCSVPAEWCQVDHIVEWNDGGLTVQDNGRLLCPRHNRQRPGRRSSTAGPPGRPRGGRTSAGGEGSPAGERRSGVDRRAQAATTAPREGSGPDRTPDRPPGRPLDRPPGGPRDRRPDRPPDLRWPSVGHAVWVRDRPSCKIPWLRRPVRPAPAFVPLDVPPRC